MKLAFTLAGALLVSAPVLAQTPDTGTGIRTTDSSSGYALLVQAGQSILPGPNGGASAVEKLPPAENLKNERLAVKRNAPAIALVRRALKQSVEIPLDQPSERDLSFSARIRELARQLSQESDVRLADGDFGGAMNSRLDTIEMGAAVGHGMIISMLVGLAVESVGRKDIDKVAAHLSATQCREAIERLGKIEARRPTLPEVLRHEQKYALREVLKNFQPLPQDIEPAEDGSYPTAKDIAEYKALTPEKLTANNARLYDALIASASLPFPQARKAAMPQDIDLVTNSVLLVLGDMHYDFSFEAGVAKSRLVRAGLELRAIKLESGSYPQTFAAPIDPFAADAKPLVYRKLGEGYLLYSVGPNGIDDDGAEIQTVTTQEETGQRTVSERLTADSSGDIVQNPF